jgi:hypothetical protein
VDHLEFDLQIFNDKKPNHYGFANDTAVLTEAEFFAKFVSPEGK